MKTAIRKRALELGFDGCRFTTAERPATAKAFEQWLHAGAHGEMGYLASNAHKRVDPRQVLGEARTLVCLATSYHSPAFDSPQPDPRSGGAPTGIVARYARYSDYHDVLAARLEQLTAWLNETAGPETRSLWYVDTGPFLERDLAQRSGLGFAGKHTNLISRALGNWFFLSEIITTAEFEPDPPEQNRCGSCVRCLQACPTQAIRAPFMLDARRCISYLTIELKGSIPEEFRPAIGSRIYGCDDCLQACPWNRFAREGQMLKKHLRNELHLPELVELLGLDDPAFKQRFDGTPMKRTKRRGLLRNVCVALGNIGDPRALPALERAARDAEPLIVEHAKWAIAQIRNRAGAAESAP